MIVIVALALENEMDLVLAHKRTMKLAEKIGLTVATQTTFATAVSEIARTVIDHTDKGKLTLGLDKADQRYSLLANISYDSSIIFDRTDEGFYYAQKLVPEFNILQTGVNKEIEMRIGISRSLKLDALKINVIREYFKSEPSLNSYEEIKRRNVSLNRLAGEQEEEIRRSKAIDEQKDEFISMASHELKTPITVIRAYTQMAGLLKDQCSDKVKEILNKIDYQSNKLQTLVQQLMDVSKMENSTLVYVLEEMGMNDFIDEMVTVMQHILPEHEISAELGEDVIVAMDKLRMEQVFSNLLGNAAKYSKKNTAITISTSLNSRQQVTVSVKDNGIGMSAEDMNSVFKKFYRVEQVKKTHPGLGMGLYITSKIVTDHGGTIWVDSEENVGSTFHFSLPLSAK